MSTDFSLPSSSSPKRVSRPSARRRSWSKGQKHTLLREFAASGLIAAQFCREQGLSEVTFSQWRRKLASAADSSKWSARFARVRVVEPNRPSTSGAIVRIETPGDWCLSVPVDCDPAWVAQLIALWPKA